MFQMEIKAKERCIRQREIPEIMALGAFIEKLDRKYGVDSRNTENTFGIVKPDKMLVSELYPENLYFSLGGYSSNPEHLPKKGRGTHSPFILDGRIGGKNLAVEGPLNVAKEDQEQLFELRRKAIEAAKKQMPRRPKFPKEIEGVIECNKILKEQGFADGSKLFQRKIWVNGETVDEMGSFVVKYGRCGNNKSPHFSTTFKGWQNQEDMPHDTDAYRFYRKWDPFHCVAMTIEEYEEMRKDLEEINDV